MQFPNSGGSGRPYARFDARTGMLFVSSPDGDRTPIDLKGKVLGIDLAQAVQGWLHVAQGATDWRPLTAPDQWGSPPSPDHKPGVEVDLVSKDPAFGDAPTRSCRGNSRAWTGFVADVASKVGEIPEGKIPVIRIDNVKLVKVGAGTSVNIEFTVAPREKWIVRDAHADAAAAQAAPKKAAPAPADDQEF